MLMEGSVFVIKVVSFGILTKMSVKTSVVLNNNG